MIEGLQPYAEYMDSGLEPIGVIPKHWQMSRAKVLFREVDERSASGKETLLSVSHISGVRRRSELNAYMFLAKSNIGHKLCQTNDLVVNTMWAWMGALGVSPHVGMVSPSYGVYRLQSVGFLLPRYADYTLRTPEYIIECTIRSTGIHSSRLRLYPEQFLRIPLIVPPIEEQAAIVRFLDHANRRLDRFIKAKRKHMRLLAEQRQRVTEDSIQLPATRSLQLGVVARQVERLVERQSDAVYIPIGLFNRGRGIFHKRPRSGSELGDSIFYWIEEEDLILSGQFAWEGAVAVAAQCEAQCIASHRYPVLRADYNLVSPHFLFAFLQTQLGAMLLNHHSRGAAGRNRPLNARTLLKEKIPIPPLSVQQRIVELVMLERSLSASVEATVLAIREYRTRLISDIVTGQLDVREAAAKLPVEEPEEENVTDVDDEVADQETEIEEEELA